ncbi:MAG: hypothetical protein FVQ83_00135 [Chloroflexi bacterium]|nr:hypothetical protein [Chloroflexota bacterium]
MGSTYYILRFIHIITAILMAWPFYALVSVNQRARLGPPLGDRADIFIENIIKNRTIPCFVFQGTALVSGILLMFERGMGLSDLFTNPALGLKFFLLLLIGSLLTYVHTSLQPKIDGLFAEAGSPIPQDIAAKIGALRARRKGVASICMFVVLTIAMLGAQVLITFPLWLNALLVAAILAFTWRAYNSTTPYGWV